MMMETTVYTREFLFVKELLATRASSAASSSSAPRTSRRWAGWPSYWPGMPPMHYATHCVGPCLGLTGKLAEWVSCLGSGRVDDKYAAALRLAVRRRDHAHQAQGLGRPRRGHALAVQHGAPVHRELRRLRQQGQLRVAADRGRGAGDPLRRRREARAGPRLRPSAPRRDPALHDQGRVRPGGRDPPVVHPGRAATAARIRTWSTSSSAASSRIATRSRTRCNRRTGPAPASARTSRP